MSPPLCVCPGSVSEPQLGMESVDDYMLQPLAGQPDVPQITPTATPPVASVVPVPQLGRTAAPNPYRMGTTGARKPTYSTSLPPPPHTSHPSQLTPPPPISAPFNVGTSSSDILQVLVGVVWVAGGCGPGGWWVWSGWLVGVVWVAGNIIMLKD